MTRQPLYARAAGLIPFGRVTAVRVVECLERHGQIAGEVANLGKIYEYVCLSRWIFCRVDHRQCVARERHTMFGIAGPAGELGRDAAPEDLHGEVVGRAYLA